MSPSLQTNEIKSANMHGMYHFSTVTLGVIEDLGYKKYWETTVQSMRRFYCLKLHQTGQAKMNGTEWNTKEEGLGRRK